MIENRLEGDDLTPEAVEAPVLDGRRRSRGGARGAGMKAPAVGESAEVDVDASAAIVGDTEGLAKDAPFVDDTVAAGDLEVEADGGADGGADGEADGTAEGTTGWTIEGTAEATAEATAETTAEATAKTTADGTTGTTGATSGEPDVGAEDQPEETLIALEGSELKRAVEALLFSLAEPVSIRALSEVVGGTVHDVRGAVEELRLEYIEEGRAFRVEDIAGGVQILTVKTYDPWVRRLRRKQRDQRLSPAALETLAVIAYKQPIGKADLEAIRGVNCAPILKTLLDRGLVHVAGRGEGLGRPLLYGTTRRFLESFGIASIRELPQPDAEVAVTAKKEAADGSELFAGAAGSPAGGGASGEAQVAGPGALDALAGVAGEADATPAIGAGEGAGEGETLDAGSGDDEPGSLVEEEVAEREEAARAAEALVRGEVAESGGTPPADAMDAENP